ncbi:PREDICTED: uncharacterized protein LOC109129964 [Camelina sativa]|uniref:Uncharacterized protein LOC109129964 n=1 Tax=Camelina sativa TaxID=90675 RepID=A0ABM1R6D0_CAMSA|nr:PREDICTED: uncharacterized protein LOC109129964 [Camelina sativa]
MIPQSSCSSLHFLLPVYVSHPLLCPELGTFPRSWVLRRNYKVLNFRFISCGVRRDSNNLRLPDYSSTRRFLISTSSNEFKVEEASKENSFSNIREDPIVDKLRTQLGVIHPIPSPPVTRSVISLFVFFFFVGVAFDKIWTWRKRQRETGGDGSQRGAGQWPQVPTSFSLFLEKDLQRKESVEWVNMVLGKLWEVYRAGIENWLVGLLQPVIDDLKKKPDYVQRVEIKQFSLGDEPLSVRNVERRTSRRANDLQYVCT